MKSVAVVTATIGRPSLQQALDSVSTQTMACNHYVVFDGVPLGTLDKSIKFPAKAEAVWLPKRTGLNGMMNGAVLAMAAYLCTEDYLCFLDDDNWLEPDHIESLVNACETKQAAYAYSLRKLVNPDSSFWANDDGESIGHHGDFIDANCYLFRRDLAVGIAPLWYKTTGEMNISDRFVWAALKQNNIAWAATGRYTVNYRMSARGTDMKPFFFMRNILAKSKFPDAFPWAA